jgi:hypothetical protein
MNIWSFTSRHCGNLGSRAGNRRLRQRGRQSASNSSRSSAESLNFG